MAADLSKNEYARKLMATAAKIPDEFKAEARVFFHHFNYAKFHFDLGGSLVKSISFANYRYITEDKREQDQLDLVADVPGTYIYTLPDSEIDAALREELRKELLASVMQTAQAQSAVSNQQFDPNIPIIPVQVTNVPSTPVQMQVVQNKPQVATAGIGITGLQSTASGTQPTEVAHPATIIPQTKAPSAADLASARLAELTSRADAGVGNNDGGGAAS